MTRRFPGAWWVIPGIAILLALALSDARADPHPHEPGQPAPVPGDVIIGDVTGEGGAGGSANNILDIDDEKQAPGLGLSTANDSVGVGITTPVFGFLVNVPWTWGDRKILATCDRIVGTSAWPDCMCRTSVMRKINDNATVCATSLGGGSNPEGKTDGPQGLNRDTEYIVSTGPDEDAQMLAQVEAAQMERYHDELKGEIAEGKEIAQAQQQEIEYLKEERAAVGLKQQELEHNQQIQQQQYDDFFDRFKRAGEARRAAKGEPDG